MSPQQQLKIPFDRPCQLAIRLRSITPAAAGLGAHRWHQVRELLIAIGYCGGSSGTCHASVAAILHVANSRDQVLPSRDAYRRAHAAAISLGLLAETREARPSGGTVIHREICHGQIERLVNHSRHLTRQARPGRKAAPPPEGVVDPAAVVVVVDREAKEVKPATPINEGAPKAHPRRTQGAPHRWGGRPQLAAGRRRAGRAGRGAVAAVAAGSGRPPAHGPPGTRRADPARAVGRAGRGPRRGSRGSQPAAVSAGRGAAPAGPRPRRI